MLVGSKPQNPLILELAHHLTAKFAYFECCIIWHAFSMLYTHSSLYSLNMRKVWGYDLCFLCGLLQPGATFELNLELLEVVPPEGK